MFIKFFLFYILLTFNTVFATTYYVRTDGSNSNLGTTDTAGGAWLTIQFAANSVAAGDTIVVTGAYNEYVNTAVAGTSGSPITFLASGTASTKGFDVDQPYQIIDGFTITDYSPSTLRGAINIGTLGDNSIVRNCIFSMKRWVSSASVVISTAGNGSITVAEGGFTGAGFGQHDYVTIKRNSDSITPLNNNNTYNISGVTDTVLSLASDAGMVDETVTAFLSGSYAYGLMIENGASNVLATGNTFTGQAAPWVWMAGTNNTFTDNILTDGDGFDAIVYSGTDNTFSYNTITNGVSVAYNASPDAFEHWNAITSTRVIFDHNIVDTWDGVIHLHKNSSIGLNGEIDFTNNVFANCGRMSVKMPNCRIANNTFYKVAFESTWVRGVQDHPLGFDVSAGNIDGCEVVNNAFIACGDGATSTKGWYALGVGQTATTNYNFVAGASTGFASKTGFAEVNGINGGNPSFLNIDSPLGVDAVSWTSDDGFNLQAGSPLIDSGQSGVDIGAYSYSAVESSVKNPGRRKFRIF